MAVIQAACSSIPFGKSDLYRRSDLDFKPKSGYYGKRVRAELRACDVGRSTKNRPLA